MERSEAFQDARYVQNLMGNYEKLANMVSVVMPAVAKRMTDLRHDFSKMDAPMIQGLYNGAFREVLDHYGMQQDEARRISEQASAMPNVDKLRANYQSN